MQKSSQSSARSTRRLGVYAEGVYAEVAEEGEARVATIPEAYGFLLFVCAVGDHFERLVLLGRDGPADLLLPSGAELLPLPYYRSLHHVREVVRATAGTARAVWRGLQALDVVWVFGPDPFALLVVAIAAVQRKRVVLAIRKDPLEYYRKRLSRSALPLRAAGWANERVWRLLARRLPVTAVGTAIAGRYGAPGNRIAMTVTLVGDDALAKGASERDWGGRVQLLTVGRIDVEKSPLLLVDALGELERLRPGKYALEWAGAGPLEAAVRERAAAYGLGERFELLGFIPYGPDLLEHYHRAHAFVHVSATEGVPGAILDAAAAGLPIVATDVGGVADALGGGEGGLLVPAGDAGAVAAAILRLTDDAGLRTRVAERALALARGQTLEAESARVAQFVAGGAT